MSSYNCEDWPWNGRTSGPGAKTTVLTGYAIMNGDYLVTRPGRGSGGVAVWSTERNAQAECSQGETVIHVRVIVERTEAK